jgi:hypothetical protein
VTFQSFAYNLVPEDPDTNRGYTDIFVHDRVTGQTSRVSAANDGTPGNYYSYDSTISADGRYIAFESEADNLVDGDTNDSLDVFVYDRVSKQIERVSVAEDGTQGNKDSPTPIGGAIAISADGRYVAFDSHADNLVPRDTNEVQDVFVRERDLMACDPLTGLSLMEGRQLGGLYTTWFGRVPDKAGWEFWRNIVVNDQLTMPQVAEQFSMSTEAHALYDYLPGDVGPDIDAAQRAMVTMFYENLFNRMPDTAGFNFWLDELKANNEFYADELSLNMIGGASPDDLARIDANIALIPC